MLGGPVPLVHLEARKSLRKHTDRSDTSTQNRTAARSSTHRLFLANLRRARLALQRGGDELHLRRDGALEQVEFRSDRVKTRGEWQRLHAARDAGAGTLEFEWDAYRIADANRASAIGFTFLALRSSCFQ